MKQREPIDLEYKRELSSTYLKTVRTTRFQVHFRAIKRPGARMEKATRARSHSQI